MDLSCNEFLQYVDQVCTWLLYLLFVRFLLKVNHHWFRQWFGAQYATSCSINQSWPRLIMAQWAHSIIMLHSLAPARFQFNIRKVIFKLTLVNGGRGRCYEIALRWMPKDLTDDKSKLVQLMAWCRQNLSQCRPRSLSPYDVTRPQWVNEYYNHTGRSNLSFIGTNVNLL